MNSDILSPFLCRILLLHKQETPVRFLGFISAIQKQGAFGPSQACPGRTGATRRHFVAIRCLYVAGAGTANNALNPVNRFGSVAGAHGAHEQEEDEGNSTNNDKLALSGVGGTVLSPDTTSLASVFADLVATELVVDKTDQSNRVTEELGASDGGLPDHHRSSDQEDILEDTAEGHYQRRSLANQEDDGNVEQESNNGIGQESPDTNVVDVTHGEIGNLKEESGDTVHDSANGSEVVERNQRVHLVLGRAEETLDHDKTGGLEDDTTNLEHETNEDELDLTERGDDNTKDNEGDVHQDLQVDRSHTHTPGSEQDSDGSGGLVLLGSRLSQ